MRHAHSKSRSLIEPADYTKAAVGHSASKLPFRLLTEGSTNAPTLQSLRNRGTWLLLCLAVIALVLQSGCADRSVTPQPTKSLLYAARTGVYHGSIDVVDCDTDSLVKTINDTLFRWGFRIFPSPDYNYLMLNGGAGALIWDVRTDQLAASLSSDIDEGIFVPGGEKFIGLGRGKTYVYSVPDFVLLRVHDLELLEGVLVNGRPWIIGLVINERTTLRVFDFVIGEVIDSIQVAPADAGGQLAEWRSLAVSPDGARVYANYRVPRHAAGIVCYDLGGDSIQFITPPYVAFSCTASPDGVQLWLTESVGLGSSNVVVLNAMTGQFVTRISSEHLGHAGGDDAVVFGDDSKVYCPVSDKTGFKS